MSENRYQSFINIILEIYIGNKNGRKYISLFIDIHSEKNILKNENSSFQ